MSVAFLIILAALFIARVLGQIVVVLRAPRWLPPMKDWYSGLMPYRYLLPAQIAIIALQCFMIRQIAHGAPRNQHLAMGIIGFASAYTIAMLVRFVILRTRHRDSRWYEGGMIPILFHWVLAAFLFTYAAARV